MVLSFEPVRGSAQPPLLIFKLKERGKGAAAEAMPMPRRRNPIYKLRRALALIISRKPITQKLLFFRNSKKYKLFRHYNYAYIGEYQFSPSNTPLVSHHYHHSGFSKKRKSRILALLCGGAGVGSTIKTSLDFGEFEPLPMSKETGERGVVEELEGNGEENGGENGEEGEAEEEDDMSVDGRAQKFIERFYEEIRLERQQSFVQWKEMLQRSC